jgi:ribosome production factor 1
LKTGPTAYFKLSNFEPGAKIPGHGKPTNHVPELILNNFSTRLGRRIGRFLGSFFPHVCFPYRSVLCYAYSFSVRLVL